MPQFPIPSSKPMPGALISAVLGNNLQLVLKLLDQGADINEKDNGGNTPLSRAASMNFAAIAIALIEKGADVNNRNMYGDTPLMLSCGAYTPYYDNSDNYKVVRALLLNGADINVQNKEGETARALAERRSKKPLVDLMKDEKIRRKHLAEEYAKAAEKKRQEKVADKQAELREAAKKRPKLKPMPPKAA